MTLKHSLVWLSYAVQTAWQGMRNYTACLAHKPYSRLFFVGDGVNWVLDWEAREIRHIAEKLGIISQTAVGQGITRQAVFFSNKYFLTKPEKIKTTKNRIACTYFHGYPASGDRIHSLCYENLKHCHHRVTRIQVSHRYMQNLILATGIDPAKVFLIPIGINPDFFSPQTPASRQVSREKYGIPQSAVVVGSFQKDGDGWGEGLTPKLIKGPDVFLQSADILKKSVPELFVLLSGPARGYVKKGLEELRIPYKHVYLEHYPQINELYHCLDLYIVASREEGGPKAILESMASGVPLVTTRVGQAMDMVVHGANGFMVDVEDAEGLAFSAQRILSDSDLRQSTVANGLRTMRRHTYTAQMPLWQKFFAGFVEHGPS